MGGTAVLCFALPISVLATTPPTAAQGGAVMCKAVEPFGEVSGSSEIERRARALSEEHCKIFADAAEQMPEEGQRVSAFPWPPKRMKDDLKNAHSYCRVFYEEGLKRKNQMCVLESAFAVAIRNAPTAAELRNMQQADTIRVAADKARQGSQSMQSLRTQVQNTLSLHADLQVKLKEESLHMIEQHCRRRPQNPPLSQAVRSGQTEDQRKQALQRYGIPSGSQNLVNNYVRMDQVLLASCDQIMKKLEQATEHNKNWIAKLNSMKGEYERAATTAEKLHKELDMARYMLTGQATHPDTLREAARISEEGRQQRIRDVEARGTLAERAQGRAEIMAEDQRRRTALAQCQPGDLSCRSGALYDPSLRDRVGSMYDPNRTNDPNNRFSRLDSIVSEQQREFTGAAVDERYRAASEGFRQINGTSLEEAVAKARQADPSMERGYLDSIIIGKAPDAAAGSLTNHLSRNMGGVGATALGATGKFVAGCSGQSNCGTGDALLAGGQTGAEELTKRGLARLPGGAIVQAGYNVVAKSGIDAVSNPGAVSPQSVASSLAGGVFEAGCTLAAPCRIGSLAVAGTQVASSAGVRYATNRYIDSGSVNSDYVRSVYSSYGVQRADTSFQTGMRCALSYIGISSFCQR